MTIATIFLIAATILIVRQGSDKTDKDHKDEDKVVTIANIESQFAKPYPQDNESNHSAHSKSISEVTKRLMLLKKMDREENSLNKDQLEKMHNYYFKLAQAPNEPWPVRVQAFRNLRNMKSFKSWSQRDKILQQVDKRILHLSQYSDQELLEKAVEYGQDN